MTTLKQSAQQALEALDKLSKLGNGNQDGNSIGNTIAQEAREQLFTALEQPEQEQVTIPPDCSAFTHYVQNYQLYWRVRNARAVEQRLRQRAKPVWTRVREKVGDDLRQSYDTLVTEGADTIAALCDALEAAEKPHPRGLKLY
jgi:hypothetical protein